MPIDAQIPLMVRPPQFESPVQTIGQIMQMRDVASQVALRQAQTATAQQNAADLKAQTDQRNRDLTDQNTVQEWMKDPANAYAFGQGKLDGLNGKVQPKTLGALQTTVLDAQSKHQTIDQATLKLNKERLEAIQSGLDGLTTLPDDDARASAWPGLKQQWASQGYLKDLPPGLVPDAITGKPDQIQGFAAQLGLAKGLTDASLARKKEVQTTATSAAQATKDTAEATKAVTETAAQQRSQDAAQVAAALEQGGPTAAQSVLSQLPPERAAIFQGITNPAVVRHLGMTPEQASAEAGKQAELARQTAQLAESLRHNKVEEGQGAARVGIEASKNRREQDIYNQTYGPGANTALQGVEPALRKPAAAAAQKAGDAHIKAQAAQRDMQSFIDLANAGNKEANAYIDTEGVLNLNTGRGISRVNRQEIDQYKGAGSAYDKVVGAIQKLATGKAKTEDVMKAMAELHSTIAQNSDATYSDALRNIDQNYRSHFSQTVGGIPTPASQAEYNALPKGAQFHKPNDPAVYRKQ